MSRKERKERHEQEVKRIASELLTRIIEYTKKKNSQQHPNSVEEAVALTSGWAMKNYPPQIRQTVREAAKLVLHGHGVPSHLNLCGLNPPAPEAEEAVAEEV